ncbi:MAG: response regulator transcription factor, partial [Chloroflexota bacterium]
LRGQQRSLAQAAEFAKAVLETLWHPSLQQTPSVLPSENQNLLTTRELEVLQLLASGQSNRDIARSLTVSLGTAKTHVHNIMSKLDAANRTEAVAIARHRGLIRN